MSRNGGEVAQHTNILCLEKRENDQEILNFLQHQVMPGEIQLFLDRAPSFFDSLEVEGSSVKVMGIRTADTNELMALGCMAEKTHWINGTQRAEKVGYLSSLRVDPKFQSSGLLMRAYEFLQSEHSKHHPDRIYLSTILEENIKAKKILTSQRAGLPRYQDIGLLITSFFPATKQTWKRKCSAEIILRSGEDQDLPALIEFWKTQSQKRQFVPAYTEQDFLQQTGLLRGLSAKDMILAFRHGKIIGCLGLWNQSSYRRWVVSAYSNKIKFGKGIYNLIAPYLNRPQLPKEHEPFPYRILSVVAVENDDLDLFESLLQVLWEKVKGQNLVISIGFHEKDPLLATLTPKIKQKLLSRLYLTSWNDKQSLLNELNFDLPPYVEFGSL